MRLHASFARLASLSKQAEKATPALFVQRRFDISLDTVESRGPRLICAATRGIQRRGQHEQKSLRTRVCACVYRDGCMRASERAQYGRRGRHADTALRS